MSLGLSTGYAGAPMPLSVVNYTTLIRVAIVVDCRTGNTFSRAAFPAGRYNSSSVMRQVLSGL